MNQKEEKIKINKKTTKNIKEDLKIFDKNSINEELK